MVTGASAPDGPGKAKVLGTAASPRDATGPAARRNRASRELETRARSLVPLRMARRPGKKYRDNSLQVTVCRVIAE